MFNYNWLIGLSSPIGLTIKSLIGSVVLTVILSGGTINFNVNLDENNVQYLGGTCQIENGDNGDLCVLLTGSVVLNRVKSKVWKGNTIEEVILAKEGAYWQYADVTRNGFKTVTISKRNRMLAEYLLIFGPICPENVVYQGQSSNGSGEYKRIKVPGQKDEIFCYQ